MSISSPLECVPMEVMRTQLETNVVGVLAVSQRFLPLLRASGGRIVNVSSGIGNVAPPYLGAYAAAQFAKEGMSDSLRRELRPLGVSVSAHPARRGRYADLGQDAPNPRTRSLLRLPPTSSRLTAPDFLHFSTPMRSGHRRARPRPRTTPMPSPPRWRPSARRPDTVSAPIHGAAPSRDAWCRIG